MIQQVLNRRFLAGIAEALAEEVARPASDRRSAPETPIDSFSEGELDVLVGALAIARERLQKPSAILLEDRRGGEASSAYEQPYIAASPEVSNLQSAIDYYYSQERHDLLDTTDSDASANHRLKMLPDQVDRRLFGEFEQTDLRWIGSLFSEGLTKFRGKHPFIPRPVRNEPIALPERYLRVIIVGDWGSGIARAQKLATFMRRELDAPSIVSWQRHVIHLGDVYYSGWKHEYRDRFLKYWPVRFEEKDIIGSFNLNGNHDMYSGGWDFFDFALTDPRFAAWQGSSSLFTLANRYWQIFGLDTSYKDADIEADQAKWIMSSALPRRKLMLLSHHQYCSSFESPATAVANSIDPILQKCDVAAWLWGHEHRCMGFNAVRGIRYPCCVGHGGVPVYQTHDANSPIPIPGLWEYRDFIDGGWERWAKFGFVTLDFDCDKVAVRYLDEDGKVHRSGDVIS